jgi:hypothetical protein
VLLLLFLFSSEPGPKTGVYRTVKAYLP